jgi:hypothetical protein
MGDFSCKTKCVCHEQYGGLLCSLTASDLLVKQSMRTNLANTLSILVAYQTADSNSVLSWVNSLYSVVDGPLELSAASQNTAAVILKQLVSSATILGIPSQRISTIFDTLNNIFEAQYYSQSSTQSRRLLNNLVMQSTTDSGSSQTLVLLNSILSSFALLTQSDMVTGQYDVEQIFSQYRLRSTAVSAPVIRGYWSIVVTTPVSVSEASVGISGLIVKLAINDISSQDIKFSLAILTLSSLGATYGILSSPLLVLVENAEEKCSSGCSVSVETSNFEQQYYQNKMDYFP